MVRPLRIKEEPPDSKAGPMLARAHQQWDGGKLRSAFRLFLAAAKLGDESAQLDLGYLYDVGIGVKPNRSAALHWYRRAYRRGSGAAANNIGTMFRDEKDSRRALAWFERAVALGDNDANLEIAKLYIRKKNQVAKAIPYLKRLIKAEAGVDVTEASREQAQGLLKTYGAHLK